MSLGQAHTLRPVPQFPVQCRSSCRMLSATAGPSPQSFKLANQRRIWGASRQAANLYTDNVAAATIWASSRLSLPTPVKCIKGCPVGLKTGGKHGSYARYLGKLKGSTIRNASPPPTLSLKPRQGNKTYAPSLLSYPARPQSAACFCGSINLSPLIRINVQPGQSNPQ